MHRIAAMRLIASGLSASLLAIAAVSCGSDDGTGAAPAATPEVVDSFYIEARVEAYSTSQPQSESLFPADDGAVSELRWWSESPDRFRWETETSEPAFISGSSVIISDGEGWTIFDANSNTFQVTPVSDFPGGAIPAPPTGFVIGPIPGGSVEVWAGRLVAASPDFALALEGTEEMLGREVSRYQFSPTGSKSSEGGEVTTSDSGRIWVDESTGMALKFELAGGEERNSTVAEVTRLDVNPDIPAERFTFRAPEGATEVEQADGSVIVQGGSGGGYFPEGFLQVGYVPGGMVSTSGSSSRGFSGYERAEATWRSLTGGATALRVRQKVRATGIPDAYVSDLALGSSAAAPDLVYYQQPSDGGDLVTLAWQDGDITVTLEGIGLGVDELMKIAVSVQRAGPESIPEG
jgi:outer membrane lipoprotein-sorting protein